MKQAIHILLVEDSADDAELLAMALGTAPFACTFACVDTEPEFLRQLRESPPDVVICDYHLPRFDSTRALSLLRERMPNTPLIVVSHSIGEDAAVEALRNGASDYLLKSRLGRLPKAIEVAIEQSSVRREKDAAEDALRQNEAQKRGILNSLHTRVALLSEHGVILAVNKAWDAFAQVHAQSQEEPCSVGTDYFKYLEKIGDQVAYARPGLAGVHQVMAGEERFFHLEYQLDSMGRTRWYVMRAMPLENGATGIVVAHEDITERMLSHFALADANKRLHLLSQRLLSIQEEERRAISRELHDDLGQTLTALIINLHVVSNASGEDQQRRFTECVRVADGALEKLRQMALDLRPPQLDQLGIEDALRWLADRHSRLTGIPIDCEFKGSEERWPATIELACFRITQEAISNATRHAEAKRLVVRLEKQKNQLKLQIQDDGKGFDPDSARERALKQGSLGLFSMDERAQLAGGRLQLHSVAGEGTVITARFALDGEPVDAEPDYMQAAAS